jgi:hypothetical protein
LPEYRLGETTLALGTSGRFGGSPMPTSAASLQLAFKVAPDAVAKC